MKLVCMAQMFNENTHKGFDGKTNLRRFMDSITKYCDALVMYDDESFDNSVKLAESYDFETHLISGVENDFENELAHKQLCLDKCRQIGATHVLWLDVDEVVEAYAERVAMRALCETMTTGGVNFFQRNLWRTDKYYRKDELWAQGLFCRLWKLTPALHYDVRPGLHQDLAPKGIIKRATTQLKVIHYGFATSDDILRKYYMYKRHGQKGRALDRLLDESSLRIAPSKPEWFSNPNWPFGPDKEVYQRSLRSML
jgi:hypothetical protein